MDVTIRSNLGTLSKDNAAYLSKRGVEQLRPTARQELNRELAKLGPDTRYLGTMNRRGKPRRKVRHLRKRFGASKLNPRRSFCPICGTMIGFHRVPQTIESAG